MGCARTSAEAPQPGDARLIGARTARGGVRARTEPVEPRPREPGPQRRERSFPSVNHRVAIVIVERVGAGLGRASIERPTAGLVEHGTEGRIEALEEPAFNPSWRRCASKTLPQPCLRPPRPLLRWQPFRFRSGLLRMPPAGLEPATRCLEGCASGDDARLLRTTEPAYRHGLRDIPGPRPALLCGHDSNRLGQDWATAAGAEHL